MLWSGNETFMCAAVLPWLTRDDEKVVSSVNRNKNRKVPCTWSASSKCCSLLCCLRLLGGVIMQNLKFSSSMLTPFWKTRKGGHFLLVCTYTSVSVHCIYNIVLFNVAENKMVNFNVVIVLLALEKTLLITLIICYVKFFRLDHFDNFN